LIASWNKRGLSIRLWVVAAFGVIAVVAIGCGGGEDDPEPSTIPAPTPRLAQVAGTLPPPSVTPSISRPQPTVRIPPTPAVADVVAVTRTEFDLVELSVPICNTSLQDGILPGFGTVPVPTPTPTPTPVAPPTPRSVDAAQAEIEGYLATATNLLRASLLYADVTNEAWQSSNGLEDRAALIFVEGRRLAALCNTVALTEFPPEVTGANAAISEFLRERVSWSAASASSIRDLSISSTDNLETRRDITGTLGDDATDSLAALADAFNIDLPLNPRTEAVESARARIATVRPDDWYLVRLDSQIVFTGPVELQEDGLVGLGTGREGYGTSIRARRVRNAPHWNLEKMDAQIRPLFDQFGRLMDSSGETVDGHEASRHRILDEEREWRTDFVITVAGDYSFIFELSCPQKFIDDCSSSMDLVLAAATLTP
jgi:hypothetical protein